jgi:beta-phosphoglucomutase-like phosphatase (HAD superfamily)/choline kinase
MNILNFKLYVFDLDGVIIDSEKHHWNAYLKALKISDCKYFKNNNLTFEKYCEINHSIDDNKSFKSILKDSYDEIYKRKKENYYSNIEKINFIEGFEDFFNKLLCNDKIICLVTDSSKEALNILKMRFPQLEKIHYIVTKDDVKQRKPSNEGYLKVLKKYNYIDYSAIIGFEDSYKGITAMSSVIYNTIFVNNNTYYYYNTILPNLNTNVINNFINIDNYVVNSYDNTEKFYISSKTKYSKRWNLLKKNFNITSNWINVDTKKKDMTIEMKQELCNQIFIDIANCDSLIFYTNELSKNHYGSIIEIGIAISLKKKIYLCGNNIYDKEVLFNFKELMDNTYVNIFNIETILYQLNLKKTTRYINYKNKLTSLMNQMNQSIDNIKYKPLDYVVISASGKGSRLLPLTEYIPKILVTYNNNCLLNNIINYWKRYANKFIVIINKIYNSLVKFYLDLLEIKYEIINVELVNNYENSYTLNKALSKEKFLNKKILITWCDIYPNIELDKYIFDDQNIIFTYKNYGRYEAHKNTLIKKEHGNVIGIYYFSNFSYLSEFTPLMDLCDCYKTNFGNFDTFEILDLVDIGDMDKLINYINIKNDKYITRYFNTICDVDDNKLHKKSTCDYGNTIIEKELNFYKYHNNYKFKPIIYEIDKNSFIMEKIHNSRQVISYFNECLQSKQFDIIKNCLSIIENLHEQEKQIVNSDILLKDINIEFKTKIINRLNKISSILNYFSFIKSINNLPIRTTHTEIIQQLSNNIISFFLQNTTKYCTIHGDCHLSNILIDINEKYYLIDPRGYFGETDIFGIDYYDIGKILYSLSGFDELNNRKNHYFIIENGNILVNINNNMDNYLVLFEKYNIPILIDMVILHWLGLAEYSKNNIHKCVSAYYYGIYLYHKYYL